MLKICAVLNIELSEGSEFLQTWCLPLGLLAPSMSFAP